MLLLQLVSMDRHYSAGTEHIWQMI